MENADILVTGARGFVGKHLVERARRRRVRVSSVAGDVRDLETVRSVLSDARPAAVIHLASVKRNASPWQRLAGDIAMVGNVICAMQELTPGATLLVPGSAAQYGMGAKRPLPESFPTVPVSAYGAIKCVLEAACRTPPLRNGVRLIWTRSFNHIGPGQDVDAPVASWARQVAESAGTGVLKTGQLDRTRDFLDVRDVADAYLALVSSGAEGVVNVCTGRPVVLREVAELLISLSGHAMEIVPDPVLGRSVDPPYIVGDPSRLRSLVDWEPSISLEQSLRDMHDEWRTRVARGRAPETATATGHSG